MALLGTTSDLFRHIVRKQLWRGVLFIAAILNSFYSYGQSNINRVEYFIDTDPGAGKGISVSISPGLDIQNLNVPINPSTLTEGVHRFYTRARNVNGAWSLTSTLLFYKPYATSSGPAAGNASNISRVEYFIDTDPGIGKASAVSITPGVDLANLVIPLNPATLNEGVHRFYTRALNASGSWSFTNLLLFYKPYGSSSGPPAANATNITQLEYFLDTDPGVGKATAFSITQGVDLSNLIIPINPASLTVGVHRFYSRAKNASGAWSLTNSLLFYKPYPSPEVPPAPGSEPNITRLEYYLDTDPGVGQATAITVTPGKNLSDVILPLNPTALTDGVHRLYLRARNADGKWSLTNSLLFYKPYGSTGGIPVAAVPNLKRLEYYVDNDPGFGNGTAVSFATTKNLIDLVIPIDIAGLEAGDHTANFRGQDENGAWSLGNKIAFKTENSSQFVVTPGSINSALCAGATVNIPFTVNSALAANNNIFTAQLSNSTGSFANAVNIGSLTGKVSATIVATIPANTAAGSGYRVRILSSAPSSTSAQNSTALTVTSLPGQSFVLSGLTSTCIGSQTYTLTGAENNVDYAWTVSGGGTLTAGAGGSSADINWTSPGNYTITVTPSNSCGNGQAKTLLVQVFNGTPGLTPTVLASGRTLQSSTATLAQGVSGYQWYLNGVAIQGADKSSFFVLTEGNYTVKYISPCGEGEASNSVFVSFHEAQTISFTIPDQTFGVSAIALSATASSGLPVTYSVVSGPATLLNSSLTITGAGTVTVRASQAGNGSFDAATLDETFTINKAAATITLSNLSQIFDGTSKAPTAVTQPAGLQVDFTYNGSVTTPTNAGTYALVATVNNSNYSGTASGTFSINNSNQTITLQNIPDRQYGNNTFDVTATASSSLPVSLALTSVPAGIASIQNNTITITGIGEVTLKASQSGNSQYGAAPDVVEVFNITKGNQQITISPIASKFINSAPFDVSATVPSGLPLTYSLVTTPMSGVASISGSTITILGATGSVTVTATQAGNNLYNQAQAQTSFSVVPTSQTITFAALADKTVGDADFALTATSTSGLAVSYSSSDASVATIVNGSQVHILKAGTVNITASQAGNGSYSAATPVSRSLTILLGSQTPDLAVQTVTANSTTIGPGDAVTVSWNIRNTGNAQSIVNWTEQIYTQASNGDNRTLISQDVFANDNILGINQSISRTAQITIPAQFNIGDQGVFVVEVVPGNGIQEAAGNVANNISVQTTPFTVKKQLTLELSGQQIAEGQVNGIAALVKRSGSLTNALIVNASFKSASRFSIPATVTIPAGQSGVSFSISSVENDLFEGNIKDTLTIGATGFQSVKGGVTIADNDKPSLSVVNLPVTAMEGSSVTFQVSTNLATANPLQVFLTSNSPTRFPVPASVTISAGSLSANVSVNLVQDNIPEIDLGVGVIAGATNHNSANGSIVINDDDVPGLELVIQTDLVPESAGFFATQATLRRKANSNPIAFTANLSADLANALILPPSITLAAGENEKTFTIGVIDNTLADGQRNVNVTASIFVASCGCSAPPASSGSVSDNLTISDDDGAALQLTATSLTLPEGLASAGILRVTRNTPSSGNLLVALTSSDTGEATVPATTTIPNGATFVDVPITTINDGLTDGSQQVYFQATTSGFSPGSVWVYVTDLNKPDLQIPTVTLSSADVQALGVFNYQVSVKNSGFATASAGLKVRGYLSKDNIIDDADSLISEDIVPQAIAVGQTAQVVNAATAPDSPGKFNLIYVVNQDLSVSELLPSNNTSQPVSFNIKPDYTATANVVPLYFTKASVVSITGSAVKANGTPASNKNLEVYIITNGFRRSVSATTNAAGSYTAQFTPLAKEAGHYIVGASFPGLQATTEQDNFDILGVEINGGSIPQFKVILSEALTGTLPVHNVSNKSLTNFTLKPVKLPGGAVMNFTAVATFAGNANIDLPYTITGRVLTSGRNFEVANLVALANEGSIQPVDAFYFCQAPQAYVVADVTKLTVSASQSKGERVVEFTLLNKGMGETGDVTISLPDVNWLTTVTPKVLPSLAPGDSAIVVLKYLALPEVPFNFPIAGSIGVNAKNGNFFNIPFSFKKVSEAAGTAKITVTDQFTFFSENEPKVAGAHVVIKNYFSGEVYAEGETDNSGVFTASGIPEGKHRISVDKDKHLGYNGTITINPSATVESTVFINYQAITFNWTVVPTAIQDQYDIKLDAQFETHVPMPVVTIEMPEVMPQLSGNEVFAFNATLTNHGLITAKDVAINLPTTDPEYEFVTNYIPADLLAQQSVQVPIIMRRRTGGSLASGKFGSPSIAGISKFLGMDNSKFSTLAGSGLNCKDFVGVVYWYKCDISTGLWQKGGVLFSYTGRSCDGPPPNIIVDGGTFPYYYGGGGGSPYYNIPCYFCTIGGEGTASTPVYASEKKSCVECINDIIGAAAGCGTGGLSDGIGALSCIFGNGLSGGGVSGLVDCIPLPLPPPISCAIGIAGAINTCSNTSVGSRAAFSKAKLNKITTKDDKPELGAVFKQISANLQVVIDAYQARDEWSKEYFGSLALSDGFTDLAAKLETYVVNLNAIPAAAQTTILNDMVGYDMSPNAIKSFFTRWNTSLTARAAGVLEPNAQYPAIINWNKVKGYSDIIVAKNEVALGLDYKSIDEMYQKENGALNEILDGQKNAVCASVKVQFSQKLTMTREAFEGTLEIFNGHPTDAMDSLSVNIQITDENGVPSNGLFEIQTKSLTNLADVIGGGNIAALEKGSVKFLFIPEILAAPTDPKLYNFGGTVRYYDPYAHAMVNLPLASVQLTVNPSPNLMLHYFMQRNILGDDALTKPEIEPIVPAELAVMVENQGYGPAVNMTISSAQPKIIENEKGLAINFSLIGSNFQGQPKKLGVTNINFGTIPPLETRIGQWYFTSSLLGKFVSYEASVVHANSFGNPDLSLVKGVKLHELTKSIKAYGQQDDGINDFLVNDIFDVADVPDIIYFSQGNRTEKVYKATKGEFSKAVGGPEFTNTLTVTASDTGWNYVKLDDPGNKLYSIVSITRSDGQIIPLDNAWLSFVTLPVSQPPVYENKFQFVDSLPSLKPVSYTVVWSPKDINIPKIVSIEGAPSQVTVNQVKSLRATFNKPIDPSTFNFDDVGLTFQGGPNISDKTLLITKVDAVTFDIDVSKLTFGNGFYALNVQTAEIADINGTKGEKGSQVTWTQFLDVPTVQAFEGLPDNKIASTYDTLRVRVNLPVDGLTVTPQRFILLKENVQVPGNVVIDSVSSDKKLYYLSGLKNLITTDGIYEFRVDLPKIKSEGGKSGLQTQSVYLTVDNSGPLMVTLEKSNVGGLDAQHIPFVNIVFNEEAFGFNTASVKLTRNGEVQQLNIAQLSNTDLKTWKAGNFGILTYPEGDYNFSVDMTGVKDVLGNAGTGTQQISWSVNRSKLLTLTDLVITPDYGFSKTDGVTSGDSLHVAFKLSADASQVTISQYDLSGEAVLLNVPNVKAGNVNIPFTLITGGNIGIRVTATGVNGGIGTAQGSLFVDQSALSAKWNFAANQILPKPIDSISITFSDKLNDSGFLNALQLRRNGTLIPVPALKFSVQSDTIYTISGLRAASVLAGKYELRFNLPLVSEYLSGKAGSGIESAVWDVQSTNLAPIARAGNDITIAAPGVFALNGDASTDPNNDPLTYSWVAPKGIILSDSTALKPSFTIPAANQNNTYPFLLLVSDGALFTTDVVNVVVNLKSDQKQNQTIAFELADAVNYGSADFTLNATASSGLPVSFVSGNPLLASITNGNQVHILNAGTVSITASQSGNSTYNAAPDSAITFVINKAQLTVTAANKTKTMGAPNPALTLTYTGFVNGDDPAALDLAPVVATSATANSPGGVYPITVSGGADANYAFKYVSGTLTIQNGVSPQTITFAALPSKTYGEADFSLTATASSGLPVSYASSDLDLATIVNGNQVHILKPGSVTITASQSGDDTYSPAMNADRTFTINKRLLNVVANNAFKAVGSQIPALNVSFNGFVNGDNSAKLITLPIAETEATAASAAGTYPIVPSGGSSDYYSFIFVNGTLTVTESSVPLAFGPIPSKVYGDADFDPGATSGQGKVVYLSGDPNTLQVVGDKLRILRAGSLQILADDGFNQLTQTITIEKAVLTATADNKNRIVGADNPALTVTLTGFVNGENVGDLTANPVAGTLADNSSPAGVYDITVSGGLATNYTFSYVKGKLTVGTTQSELVFAALPIKVYGNPDFDPGAVSGTRKITYTSSNLKVALIVDGKIKIVGAGRSEISASDDLTSLSQLLQVNKAALTITADAKTKKYLQPNPLLTFKAKGFVNGDDLSKLLTPVIISTTALDDSPLGTYPIKVGGATSDNYAIKFVDCTLTINCTPRVFVFNEIPVKTYGDAAFVPAIQINTSEKLTFESADKSVAEVEDGKIKINGVGKVLITVSVQTNKNYTGATEFTRTLEVIKATQVLQMDKIPVLQRRGEAYVCHIKTNSGLPVNLQIADQFTASLDGNSIIPLRVGKTHLTVSQAGNANYLPLTEQTIEVVVSDEKNNIVRVHPAVSADGDGINDFLTIEGISDYPDNSLIIVSPNGKKVFFTKNYDNQSHVFIGKNDSGELLQQGTYFYQLEFKYDGGVKKQTGYVVLKY